MITICPHCNHVFESTPTTQGRLTTSDVYRIIDTCCDYFDTTRVKVFSNYRGGTVTKARHIAMYLIYGEEKNGWSFERIGKLFGGRDHTTVINARNRCRDSFFTKGDVYNDIIVLSHKVNQALSKEPKTANILKLTA